MPPEDPVRLGSYHVVRRLRDVAIGTTLLGTDQTGRAVVLTVVDAGLAARPGFRERFAREARAAAAAPPAVVAAVLDVDAAADPPWLATVAVAGSSLEELVRAHGPLGEPGVAALARRLADGFAALHAAGLVHGDLTPAAVVLAEEGPRLVGFGLARAAGPGHGTPGYEAPEQIAGSGADQTPMAGAASDPAVPTAALAGDPAGNHAVDVFALGCVLGYAATGRSPFAAADPAATRWRTAHAEPDVGALAEPLRSTVLACLHRDPAQRRTAAQVAAQVAAQLTAPPARATAPTVNTALADRPGSPTRTLVGASPIDPHGGPPPQQAAWAGGPAPHPSYGPQRYGPPASAGPPRGRGPLVAALVLAAVVVLAVVGGVALLATRGAGTPVAGPTATTSAAPAPAGSGGGSPVPSSSAVTETNVDPGTGATLVDPTPFGADSPHFVTPSHNIACQISQDSGTGARLARCDVAQRSWQLPATPVDCPGVFGTGAQVYGTDHGTLTCASDTLADPSLPVLQYGQALSFGGIVCDSEDTGVRCVNRSTGHGFRVARASYDLF